MPPSTLILGIGNVLWADEGFGVRAVEYLHQHYTFGPNVTLLDGGTQGLYLLEPVQQAQILVVLDAIDYGLEPGTLKLIEDDAVPSYLGAKKMSLHQTGFQEVLGTATLLGDCPQQLLLAGVQPEQIEDFGGSLSQTMQNKIVPTIEAALAWLAERGITAEKRDAPLPPCELLGGAEIDIATYVSQRPSAEQASRVGDDRVLLSSRYQVQFKPHPLDPQTKISCDVDHRGQYPDAVTDLASGPQQSSTPSRGGDN